MRKAFTYLDTSQKRRSSPKEWPKTPKSLRINTIWVAFLCFPSTRGRAMANFSLALAMSCQRSSVGRALLSVLCQILALGPMCRGGLGACSLSWNIMRNQRYRSINWRLRQASCQRISSMCSRVFKLYVTIKVTTTSLPHRSSSTSWSRKQAIQVIQWNLSICTGLLMNILSNIIKLTIPP